MKINAKNIVILLLAMVMVAFLYCTPAAATEPPISSIEASYDVDTVNISGTAKSGVLAAAVLIYEDNTLLRLKTTGVSNGTFDTKVKIALAPGTYTAKAADYEGGAYAETTFTVASSYQAEVSGGGSLPVVVDAGANSASVDLETISGNLADGKNTTVTFPSISGVTQFTASLPASALSGTATGSFTIDTGSGRLTIPGNMLSGMGLSGDAAITIGTAAQEGLPKDVRTAIGDRPLLRLSLTVDGQPIQWDHPGAPVTVSIPYQPTAEERKHPESIIIWYIDGDNNLVCIPNGRYDAENGMVTFETCHFSLFAVGYHSVSFADVSQTAWYYQAVSGIAAREITFGTSKTTFHPDALITRGQFITMLMRAYAVAEEEDDSDNFADAGDTYYTHYLAAAKRLGIAQGVGKNLFAPNQAISRQEIFTLLYRTMDILGQPRDGNSGKTLDDFSDAANVASWAKEATAYLVETGAVAGYAGKLYPTVTATRAETAQVLYRMIAQ